MVCSSSTNLIRNVTPALDEADLEKTEVTTGSVLIAIGIGPVITALLTNFVLMSTSLPPDCFSPAASDLYCGSRFEVQFRYFWFFISFFTVGIGAWFFVSGVKSVPIISKKNLAKP